MNDPRSAGPAPIRAAALKRRLRALLDAGDQDAIGDLAAEDHRVFGGLIALTYDADPAIAWRAVHGLGTATDRVADREPDVVRNYLRRLFWLITEESGGICWFAPQGLAEIARQRPERFGDFIPIAINLLREMADEDLEHFRPGVLWAIGRLGPLAAPHVDEVIGEVERALDDPDPLVRGLAVRVLGRVGRAERLVDRPALFEDGAELELWEDGEIRTTTVARLVERATG